MKQWKTKQNKTKKIDWSPTVKY